MTASTSAPVGGVARVLASAGARAGRVSATHARLAFAWTAWAVRRWLSWASGHRRWVFWCLVLSVTFAGPFGNVRAGVQLLAFGVLPGVVAVAWQARWPVGFERWCAGPWRRMVWRRWARRVWPVLARECGLSVAKRVQKKSWTLAPGRDGALAVASSKTVNRWVDPALCDVVTKGNTLVLFVKARLGQTPEDLERAVPAIATAAGAASYRVRQWSPSVVEVTLVMQDRLATPSTASMPTVVESSRVTLGRRQDGSPWRLQVRGRHTLAVGCSGAGKGSILWGVAGGLAPAVAQDTVRLWGIDMKKGLEVGMGADLFAARAYTGPDAVGVLTALLDVIDARGAVMIGQSRLHEPVPGDPLHVLVIDELADLLAYSEKDVKAEANRLLAKILTQGRALGVVVLACVQDPRKETIGMRGLFTQTIALRLRSADETRMVLGDGAAAKAPAHRLNPDQQGSAYVVADEGSAEKVRAHYWPDSLVRAVAQAYPAPVQETIPVVDLDGLGTGSDGATGDEGGEVRDFPAGRKPRGPRKPRRPRGDGSDDSGDGSGSGDAA